MEILLFLEDIKGSKVADVARGQVEVKFLLELPRGTLFKRLSEFQMAPRCGIQFVLVIHLEYEKIMNERGISEDSPTK